MKCLHIEVQYEREEQMARAAIIFEDDGECIEIGIEVPPTVPLTKAQAAALKLYMAIAREANNYVDEEHKEGELRMKGHVL